MSSEQTDRTMPWVLVVGVAAMGVAMGFAFGADAWSSPENLNFLIPLFFVNPVIFAAGVGVAYWRTGRLSSALIVFGVYLLAFAVFWMIASGLFSGFSWENLRGDFTPIGPAYLGYLAASALVVLVLFLIRKARGSARA
mgnify:CR=1 FL=1